MSCSCCGGHCRQETENQEVFKYISPLKTNLELWLSQQGLRPNALLIILLLAVGQANRRNVHEKRRKETETGITSHQKKSPAQQAVG